MRRPSHGVKTFEALARRESPRELYPHLVEADLLVIAPLSANTLAKLAHGLADNVLTQTALAFDGPVLVAPAMNVRMWENAASQANVASLEARGVELIGPEEGELAEGRAWNGAPCPSPRPSSRAARRLLAKRGELAEDAGARQRRRHARAARRGALPRQPLVRPHGRRARRGGAAPWRR